MAHLDVADLTVAFKVGGNQDMKALDAVSFSLERGGTLGIVGESGSGKSTLARALLGYTRPGARVIGGKVQVGDINVFELGAPELRAFRGARAAMVPQNPLSSLTPHMTIGEQLTELVTIHGGRTNRDAKDRVRELMAATGLPSPDQLAKRYPHELSGGQRQRVVIASALAADPELIILDEPTTALDKTVETRVLDLVTDIRRRSNTTLVYVSHDLNVIARMCERVLVLRDGVIVEEGTVDQIFDHPKTDYASTLVRAMPTLEAKDAPASNARDSTLLSVHDLRFAYRTAVGLFGRQRAASPAVDNVSFTVAAGKTLGIVGESGSGKSTIAGLIAGSLFGHDGEIRLRDQTLAGPAKRRDKGLRRCVQMIFQDPLSSLNPSQTIGEILTRPLSLYFGMSRAAAHEEAKRLLADLELPAAHLERRPRMLSGGQQQRVAIARALTAKPDVIICDEITSALDVTIQALVLQLLKRLQADYGMAYLFISHDLAVVADMADEMIVLEHGQLRDYGSTRDVLENPSSPYTRRLLDAFLHGQRSVTTNTEPEAEDKALAHA